MTDRHMRILRHMARQTQRELDHHDTLEHGHDTLEHAPDTLEHAPDTLEHAGDAASAGRRDSLKYAARRARGQVAGALQRRRAAEQSPQDPPPQAPPPAGTARP